jgi:hypothetical protein
MKPNFLVVGAAKSGTTWLYYCLKEHPEIYVSIPKELNFFSNDSNYYKGYKWYTSYFEKVSSENAIGELSPSYMYPPQVPKRIYEFNPDIKLIFILRNPIDRAYSDYCMNLDHGVFTRDIDNEMTTSSRIVHQGLYFKQIQEYLKYFPREQLLITFYDDLNIHPELFLKTVYSFLEVDSEYQPDALGHRENARKPLPKYEIIYNFTRSIYGWILQRNRLAKPFFDELKRKGYFDTFYAFMRGSEHPRPSKEVEEKLTIFFREDVSNLSELVQRDLSFWLND